MKKWWRQVRRDVFHNQTLTVAILAVAQGVWAAEGPVEFPRLMQEARAHQQGLSAVSFGATAITWQSDDPIRPPRPVERYELDYRRMGEKVDMISHRYAQNEEGQWIPSYEMRAIWNGMQSLQRQQSKHELSKQRLGALVADRNKYQDQFRSSQTLGGFLEGRFWHHTQESWIDVLERASAVSVGPDRELISGGLCQVVTAKTPYGDYRLWVDSSRGCCIRQAEIVVAGDNLAWGQPLSQHRLGRESPKTCAKIEMKVEDIEIEKVGDRWFPTKGVCSARLFYTDGTMEHVNTQVQRSNVNWNPDFEAMGAFVMDLPDGTPVQYEEYPGIRYEWRGGKVVTAVDASLVDELNRMSEQLHRESPLDMASMAARAGIPQPSSLSEETIASGKRRPEPWGAAGASGTAAPRSTPVVLYLSVLVCVLVLVVGLGLFAASRRRTQEDVDQTASSEQVL